MRKYEFINSRDASPILVDGIAISDNDPDHLLLIHGETVVAVHGPDHVSLRQITHKSC